MDLALTPELVEIQQRSRRFLDEHLLPVELQCELEGGLPSETLARIARGVIDARLHAVNMPREWGGQGYSWLEQVISQEQLGRSTNALWDVVWRPANVLRHCNDEQRERYLLPEIKGERRYAYAVTEPHAGSDASRLQTRAVRTPGGWRIDGEKWFVTAADVADYLIVVADAEGHGPTAFLIDQGTPGLRETRRPRYMHTFVYEHPEYVLEGCEVPDAQVLGGLGKGHELSREWFIEERLMIAARCLGGAQRALEVALEYACEREQFGQRIVDFQGVSFPLASSAVELAAARAFVYQVAWEASRGLDPEGAAREGVGDQAARLRDGRAGRRSRAAGARRARLHAREPRRAALPRPPRRPHLGGDVRDPAGRRGERARQARPRDGHRVARVVRPSVERERRVQLTAAAARVIARKGYEAATLRDVADEAGTSTGTLNYYYHGKDELFAATLRAASERFQAELGAAVASASSPRDKLVAMARAATPATPAGREGHAVWIDFWAQAARDASLRELNRRIYDRWRGEIAGIVREGQAEGSFAADADPDAFARGYAAVIDGLATHVVLHDGLGPAEMEAACSAYVDAALGTV